MAHGALADNTADQFIALINARGLAPRAVIRSMYVRSSVREHELPIASFTSHRVNSSTFVIIEDDKYGEQPYIYVRKFADHLLVTDTGCNSPRSERATLTSLRDYLETYPIPSNGHQCLNPVGQKKYIIICSHCHYDHILGIPQFLSAKPTIIASSFEESFLLEDFPTHSLCKFMGIATPQYTVTIWADHMVMLSLPGLSARVQFLHIPGHTPDSLAWYDIDEHHLFVGDTFYQRKRSLSFPDLPEDGDRVLGLPTQGAIIFPEEGGNWIQFMSSLELLLSFVLHQNRVLIRQHGSSHASMPRVLVGCGHITYNADAEYMIREVQALFRKIILGSLPITSKFDKRGVEHGFWLENEDAKYSKSFIHDISPRYCERYINSYRCHSSTSSHARSL